MANMLLFKLQYEISPDVNCDLLIYYTIKPVDKLYIEHRNKFLNHLFVISFHLNSQADVPALCDILITSFRS